MSETRPNENASLLEKIRDGDGEALERLVRENAGLVRGIALRFTGRGIEYEDLVQIGTIGMIRAARSFDPAFGCVFSTYAVPLITGEIKRTLRDDGSVKIGRELKRRAAEAACARDRFEARTGREPRLSELAEEAGMCPQDAAQALAACLPVRSLSEPASGDDGPELGQTVADPDDLYEAICEKLTLKSALSALDPFERKVVYLRYRRELSQSQTGRILGASQVRISRTEKKIVEKLRRMMGVS